MLKTPLVSLYLDWAPDPHPHEHHAPHPSAAQLAAFKEYKAFLDSLPRREYKPVIEELLRRINGNIV